MHINVPTLRSKQDPLVLYPNANVPVMVKMCGLDARGRMSCLRAFQREVAVIRALGKPIWTDDWSCFIVPAHDEDLFDYIDRHDGRHPMWEAVTIARKAAAALARLHDIGYSHGDVKPENLVWRVGSRQRATSASVGGMVRVVRATDASADIVQRYNIPVDRQAALREFLRDLEPVAPGDVSLIDFETATAVGAMYPSTNKSTTVYCAPEYNKDKRPFDRQKADVWSLGVSLVSIITGCALFSLEKPKIYQYLIKRQEMGDSGSTVVDQLLKHFGSPCRYEQWRDSGLISLFGGMLTVDPARRPCIDTVVDKLRKIQLSV
jgi:serine/threonine protein kinase